MMLGERRRWRRGALSLPKKTHRWRRGVLNLRSLVEQKIWSHVAVLQKLCGSVAGGEFVDLALRLLRGCHWLPSQALHADSVLALLSLAIAFGSNVGVAHQWRGVVVSASKNKRGVLRAEHVWMNAIGGRHA